MSIRLSIQPVILGILISVAAPVAASAATIDIPIQGAQVEPSSHTFTPESVGGFDVTVSFDVPVPGAGSLIGIVTVFSPQVIEILGSANFEELGISDSSCCHFGDVPVSLSGSSITSALGPEGGTLSFGARGSATFVSASEPSTIVILASTLLGFGWVMRRHWSKA